MKYGIPDHFKGFNLKIHIWTSESAFRACVAPKTHIINIRSNEIIAITFVNNIQTSIVNTREELINEINHFKCFYLTNLNTPTYENKERTVKINVIEGFTPGLRKWLSSSYEGDN